MKVTVKDKHLNVRAGSPSVNAPTYQYLAPGSEIEVDGKLYKGDEYDGIDTWVKDAGGNYYWSGGVHTGTQVKDPSKLLNGKTTYGWFNQLKINEIWNQYNERGDRVKIAVLDTGYNISLPELKGKIKETNTKILIRPEDYPKGNLVIADRSNDFHGTRCASLIGSANNRNWIVGIAPECELLVGKISFDGEIDHFNYILDGIRWALSLNADVISISYSHKNTDTEQVADFNRQLNVLMAGKNALIFGAAGNTQDGQSGERYPASFEDCISVGASNHENKISAITVISNKTIIHAPGDDIEAFGNNDSPTAASGTSFATPIVAALVGLAVSYVKKKNNGQWRKSEIIDKLYSSASPIGNNTNKKIINPLNLFKSL